ncbi:MAG: fused MFS/spermidine synthase [Anaerolineae bacterium]|nr:fused MFS/spermidine synthase [Anaerolineae bacterium]MDW8068887.1 fused MFS/spermidine synthase [Anaerolineae bacterium]
MRFPLLTLGFTTTVAQVLLVRELVAVFYGNELVLGLILAAWLAWGALGAGLAGRWSSCSHKIRKPMLAGGLALLGLLPTFQMLLVRAVRGLLRVPPGALVEFGPMVGTVALTVAPVCLLGGALFPLLARRLAETGHLAGQAYLWECAGAAVGGILFSFVFIRYLDPFQTAALILTASLAAAGSVLAIADFRLRAVSLLFPTGCFLVLGFSLLTAPLLHRSTLRWQWSDLIFAADSPYGRLVVQARESQRVFYENGILMFETQGTRPEEVVHPPLLAHPDPREVLLIGGAAAGNLREILRHPVAHVTVVESDPLLLQAARLHLPPEEAAVLDDPRVTVVLADGRRFVRTARQTFDVVILDLPEPSTGALNRFYTEEFFQEVQARLNPGGLLALGLPAAENYWSPELSRRNGSVYHTLRAVFPHVLVLPGDTIYFLASADPLEADPDRWGERLTERGIPTRWMTAAYIRYLFTTDRFAQVQGTLERMARVRLNRDLTPICYYYDLALWLSRFTPRLRGFFERTDLLRLGWVALALALPVGLSCLRRRWAIPIAVGGAGLAGMMLEMVILLAFQVRYGSLYAQVSLLVAAYMVGMVVGSQWGSSRRWGTRQYRRTLLALMGTLALGAAILPFLLRWPLPLPVFPLLALLTGGWGGVVFPLALQAEGGDVGWAAGRLYGADLAGGCLGALLGGTVFIPLLGIPQTCGVVALVGLASGLALLGAAGWEPPNGGL